MKLLQSYSLERSLLLKIKWKRLNWYFNNWNYKGAIKIKFRHIHPIYTSETEQKNAIKEKYEKIYGSIIERRKNNESFFVTQTDI